MACLVANKKLTLKHDSAMLAGIYCNPGCYPRLSEKSFVLFVQYPPDEQTYSTLKFMRSTCGKSTVLPDSDAVGY